MLHPGDSVTVDATGTDPHGRRGQLQLQPIDHAEESVNVSNVTHCSTVTVSIVNYTATGLDPITLTVGARL